MKRHDCTTHRPGTKTCYDHCGCRCYDCGYERSRYVYDGRRHMVSAAAVAQQVRNACDTAGVTVIQVARDADVPPTTLYAIVNGDTEAVSGQRAAQILVVCRDLCAAAQGRRLPVGPLRRAVEARASDAGGIRPVLNGDTRTYYRSVRRGWVQEEWADRIACTVLGEPLELLYGTDYREAA